MNFYQFVVKPFATLLGSGTCHRINHLAKALEKKYLHFYVLKHYALYFKLYCVHCRVNMLYSKI